MSASRFAEDTPAQIQTGRLINGSMLFTFEPPSSGATSGPLSLDQVMTLSPPDKTGQKADWASHRPNVTKLVANS